MLERPIRPRGGYRREHNLWLSAPGYSRNGHRAVNGSIRVRVSRTYALQARPRVLSPRSNVLEAPSVSMSVLLNTFFLVEFHVTVTTRKLSRHRDRLCWLAPTCSRKDVRLHPSGEAEPWTDSTRLTGTYIFITLYHNVLYISILRVMGKVRHAICSGSPAICRRK